MSRIFISKNFNRTYIIYIVSNFGSEVLLGYIKNTHNFAWILLARELGFEPRTDRLHIILFFRKGVDYIIIQLVGCKALPKTWCLSTPRRDSLWTFNDFRQSLAADYLTLPFRLPAIHLVFIADYSTMLRITNFLIGWNFLCSQPIALPLSYSRILNF